MKGFTGFEATRIYCVGILMQCLATLIFLLARDLAKLLFGCRHQKIHTTHNSSASFHTSACFAATMPLPETLPKASSSRKTTARKRSETCVTRYSTGLTTADENTSAKTPVSAAWKSDMSSASGGNYTAEDVYTTDHYTTEDEWDEYRDDQYMNERYPDDNTSVSSHGKSLGSAGTGNTSVSAGSSSNYSELYEPRLIQQHHLTRTSSVRDSTDKRLLPDISEEDSWSDNGDENVETVYRKPKSRKLPSWKKLFKRSKSKGDKKDTNNGRSSGSSLGTQGGKEKRTGSSSPVASFDGTTFSDRRRGK